MSLLGARYYDPVVGAFLSPDPIGIAGGINQFAYCGGDPVNWTDPSGLDWRNLGAPLSQGDVDFVKGVMLYGTTLGGFIGGVSGGTGGAALGFVGGAGVGAIPGGAAGTGLGILGGGAAGGAAGAAVGFGLLYGGRAVDLLSTDLATFARSKGLGASCPSGAGSGRTTSGKKPKNPIIDLPRVGSGLKVDHPRVKPGAVKEFPGEVRGHGFPDIVDNFVGRAKTFELRPGVKLYQMKGSLNGTVGRFEYIEDQGRVTHRMFVPGGGINGRPIKP